MWMDGWSNQFTTVSIGDLKPTVVVKCYLQMKIMQILEKT